MLHGFSGGFGGALRSCVSGELRMVFRKFLGNGTSQAFSELPGHFKRLQKGLRRFRMITLIGPMNYTPRSSWVIELIV